MRCWPIIYERYVQTICHELYQVILNHKQQSCLRVEPVISFFAKVSFIYPSFIQVKRLTDTKMFH